MNEIIISSNGGRMSSLEIAQIADKRHSDVLEAIRNMEPAWEKIAQRKFPLGSYKDSNNQNRPCYYLDKKECLYVATKFNDEARAKLVLRWEELEKEKQVGGFNIPQSFSQALLLAAQQAEKIEKQQLQISVQQEQIESMGNKIVDLVKKSDYLEIILQSKETVTITQIAQDYGMSARTFNKMLADFKIQRKVNGQWILYAPYNTKGYVHSHTTEITHKDGTKGTVLNTEWRQSGRIFLYEFLKSKDVLPLIEKSIIGRIA